MRCVCLCVCIQCSVCYATVCSVVVLGLAGGTGLGVRSSASQPNTENVLPAPSNIFSNTLHSFLTCTTTSAQTTLSPPLTRAAPQVAHKHSIVPLGFLLMCKMFYNAPFCCPCILGVKQLQRLQFLTYSSLQIFICIVCQQKSRKTF